MDRLEEHEIDSFKDRYDKIIKRGLAKNPVKKRDGPKKRGRIKQSKATNLLLRLKKYREETLLFMYDFDVPFENNRALSSGIYNPQDLQKPLLLAEFLAKS